MTATISIKAAEGRKVRDPRTGELVPGDRFVSKPKINFWLRRVSAGDVIVQEKAAVKPKKSPKPKKKTGDEK